MVCAGENLWWNRQFIYYCISVTNLITISITCKEQNMSKVCYMITRVLFRTLSKWTKQLCHLKRQNASGHVPGKFRLWVTVLLSRPPCLHLAWLLTYWLQIQLTSTHLVWMQRDQWHWHRNNRTENYPMKFWTFAVTLSIQYFTRQL